MGGCAVTAVADLAYKAVRESILSGAEPPGARLREEELAASIGVSRTPVREALRRLQAEGLVEILPNRGAVVVGWPEDELDEIFDLRTLLEGYSARRAAGHTTAEQLAELHRLCDTMDLRMADLTEEAYGEITDLNLHFHRVVHGAAANRRLLPLLAGIIQAPLVHHTFHRYTHEELARSFAQHRELVQALAAGDPDWAESVMHCHVRAARASLRRADYEAPPDGLARDGLGVPGASEEALEL
jgi:DNA-binding GntR family transcriptional regulator